MKKIIILLILLLNINTSFASSQNEVQIQYVDQDYNLIETNYVKLPITNELYSDETFKTNKKERQIIYNSTKRSDKIINSKFLSIFYKNDIIKIDNEKIPITIGNKNRFNEANKEFINLLSNDKNNLFLYTKNKDIDQYLLNITNFTATIDNEKNKYEIDEIIKLDSNSNLKNDTHELDVDAKYENRIIITTLLDDHTPYMYIFKKETN